MKCCFILRKNNNLLNNSMFIVCCYVFNRTMFLLTFLIRQFNKTTLQLVQFCHIDAVEKSVYTQRNKGLLLSVYIIYYVFNVVSITILQLKQQVPNMYKNNSLLHL